MAGFWERMLGRDKKGSGATAKERLQFVLFHDRINLPPEKLEMMKKEILAVISKYVAVDEDHVDIALQQGDRRGSLLVAEIPFRKANEGIEQDDIHISISLAPSETKEDSDEPTPEAIASDGADAAVEDTAAEETQEATDTQDTSPEENDKTKPHKT